MAHITTDSPLSRRIVRAFLDFLGSGIRFPSLVHLPLLSRLYLYVRVHFVDLVIKHLTGKVDTYFFSLENVYPRQENKTICFPITLFDYPFDSFLRVEQLNRPLELMLKGLRLLGSV